jgi:hypothetical protein
MAADLSEAKREAIRAKAREKYRERRAALGFTVRPGKRGHVTSRRGNPTRKPDAKGAYFHSPGLWFSAISLNGRTVRLGYYRTAEEASAVYWAARRRIEGAADEGHRS